MTAIETAPEAVLSRELLRTFHLTGLGLDEALPSSSLRPSILTSLPDLPALEAYYPMCVHPDGSARGRPPWKYRLPKPGWSGW